MALLPSVCCNMLVCCSVWQSCSHTCGLTEMELQHSVLQCVAVCCSVLQCVAVCCSVLQCVAVSQWHDGDGTAEVTEGMRDSGDGGAV